MGDWNEYKRMEVVNTFRKGKLDRLCKVRMKGSGMDWRMRSGLENGTEVMKC